MPINTVYQQSQVQKEAVYLEKNVEKDFSVNDIKERLYKNTDDLLLP